MGYASAMAWVLFIIILICTLLLLKVSDRFTYYSG
jgi:multiple sugar transport system permease protein